MEQIAFKMQLKQGNAAKYKRRHDLIWPELLTLLTDTCVRDYSIFPDEENSILLATLQRIPQHRMNQLSGHPVMQRWCAYMADLMLTDMTLAPVPVALIPIFHSD